MISAAEAGERVLGAVAELPAEDCPLAEAHGRVLRQALTADRDLPPFDRVTLDGYALRYAAWRAGRRQFSVAGLQAAGAAPVTLTADGACIEVMTGAVLPDGADMVVPYEEAARQGDLVVLSPDTDPSPGQGIHRRASDRRAGDTIVRPGQRLRGVEIAVAAACGQALVTVTVQPRIAVLATGDELVDAGQPVASHQIRRSNDYALRAALAAAGFPRVDRHHLRDRRHDIEEGLRRLIADYDAVVITGGVSKGKFDHLPGALEELGVRALVHGVAQRPGKPFWFGIAARGTPVFALPGNPVSSYVCLHRYALPALTKMSGCEPAGVGRARLAEALPQKSSLTWFVPVRIAPGSDGERRATPSPPNTSGDFAGLAGTDGFVELAPGPREWPAGTWAPFWRWA